MEPLRANDEKLKWLDSLPKRASSAAMILENSAGQVLIVMANYKSYWTLPGGVIDPDETPKEAAIRETFEEVGIAVEPDTVEFVAIVDRKSEVAQTYQFIFKAPLTDDMVKGIVLQESEIDKFMLVTRDEVRSKNLAYGKVTEHWMNGTTGYIEQTFDANSLLVS